MTLFVSSCTFLCLLLILSLSNSPSAIANNNETDRLSLLEFKSKITDDPSGFLISWNDSNHICLWNGITCNLTNQRVIGVDLRSRNLRGSISPHIGNLSLLRDLTLYNNTLAGTIPPEVGFLHSLTNLDLRNNSLVGNIPANLSGCRSLVLIYLSRNHLSGEIPEEIGSLRNLQAISFRENNLTGHLPSSIANLSSLLLLDVLSNHLSGRLPYSLGRLKHLQTLEIGDNSFGGTIPPSFFNLSSLEELSLSKNNFTGSFPPEFGLFFPNLKYFGTVGNQFTGSIPPSISNATNLESLYLASNRLTGGVPSFEGLHKLEMLDIGDNLLGSGREGDLRFFSTLTNATNLRSLAANDNNLGGVLPVSVTKLSAATLRVLGLNNNQIVGSVPAGIGNLQSLQSFWLPGNQLSGSIPEDIGKLRMLRILHLDHNNFTGHVPLSLGNLDKLLILGLSGNKLQGGAPLSLGQCQRLLEFDLSHNNLTGSIPSNVFTISSLTTFNLSGNRLTGAIPRDIGKLKAVNYLDVSQNMLSGEIPSTLGDCLSLGTLSMGGNFLKGIIPSSFASLRGLQHLNLSHNNLSGVIPTFLESFDLQSLDLSFNNFSGMVPSGGVFKNASVTSVKGNNMLCGGTGELPLPICPIGEPKKRRFTLRMKIIISSIVLSFLALSVILTLIFWLSRKKSKETASDPSMNSILQVSYQILSQATNGFSSTNLMGTGSFASVYKGMLDSKGMVAVKVFNMQRRGASKSFMAECEALRNIRHRNLVKVITACSSIDSHGDDFKAIVYEFMVNGSLDQWLHPSETQRELNFKQRLGIAIDIASALDYLHNQHGQTPIVHCDLKPSNVLLDEEMTAQVGDFGLMKFLLEGTGNLSIKQATSTGVRGTIGYVASEYGMGSEVSTYGDMYSFGILLLEMFTGKSPTDDMFDDNMNLHNYVKMALSDQVSGIAGVKLDQQKQDNVAGGFERDEKVKGPLLHILDIGVACSEETVSSRMNIRDALAKLTVIKDDTNEASREINLTSACSYSQRDVSIGIRTSGFNEMRELSNHQVSPGEQCN